VRLPISIAPQVHPSFSRRWTSVRNCLYPWCQRVINDGVLKITRGKWVLALGLSGLATEIQSWHQFQVRLEKVMDEVGRMTIVIDEVYISSGPAPPNSR
jgi:hypothetical protein